MMPNWPHPGCVGLWHFENDGTDSSGAGNNGSGSGGEVYTLGKFGKCAYLTADDYFLPYSSSLKVSDLTVSAWYNSTSNDNPGVLLACSGVLSELGYYGYYGYRFETLAGKATLIIGGRTCYGARLVNDGAWHFLMATRNDSVARVYVDGRIEATWANPDVIQYCSHSPGAGYYAGAFIGAAYFPANPPVIGHCPTCYLDELMLENYAIGPEEALDRYLFQKGEI